MAIKNNIPAKRVQPKRLNLWWLVIILIFFGQLMTYTWIRTESTQAMLRVSRAEDTYIKKVSYRKALSVERDRLKSDDRITRIAKTRLNLSTDTMNQTIYLAPSPVGEDG